MPPLPASVNQRHDSTFLGGSPALDERQLPPIEQAPVATAGRAVTDAAGRLIDVEQQQYDLGPDGLGIIRRTGHPLSSRAAGHGGTASHTGIAEVTQATAGPDCLGCCPRQAGTRTYHPGYELWSATLNGGKLHHIGGYSRG